MQPTESLSPLELLQAVAKGDTLVTRPEAGQPFQLSAEFEPSGDQPVAIAELVGGPARGCQGPGAARRHRLRQDVHDGALHPGAAAAGDHPGPQQDPGGTALRRVQVVLSEQRGRVFRQLLRLLPARGLRAALGHLYREDRGRERADRPDAPLGDPCLVRARRRHHRGLGLLHLRHRLARDLCPDDAADQQGPKGRAAAPAARPGRAAIQAQRARFQPRRLPCEGRHHRDLPGPPRRPGLADLDVRRRDRSDPRIRSPDRRRRARSWSRSGSTRTATTSRRSRRSPRRSRTSRSSSRRRSRISAAPASCSRPSASSSAPWPTSR